jgi:SAM-dependent methyltransferase
MFELASLNELVQLKKAYLPLLYPEEHQWGLKQFGTLFCFDKLRERSGRVLEAGAGQNNFFDKNLPPEIDYWMVDKAGFYDPSAFANSAKLRKRTTFRDGLLGDFDASLPSDSFDAIFSISVLEHVPVANIAAVCADMFRLLKSGGRLIHTLDLEPLLYESVGKTYLAELLRVGFRFEKEPAVDYSRVALDGLLVEPAAIVFKYYYGQKPDPWENPPKINRHTATIKIVAEKA